MNLTFSFSSRLMAKASCSWSSSSPLVCGRALSNLGPDEGRKRRLGGRKEKCLIQLLALDEKGQTPPLNVKQAPKSLLFHARAGIASLCLFDSAGETMGCLCGAGEQRRGDGAYIIITPPDRFYLQFIHLWHVLDSQMRRQSLISVFQFFFMFDVYISFICYY